MTFTLVNVNIYSFCAHCPHVWDQWAFLCPEVDMSDVPQTPDPEPEPDPADTPNETPEEDDADDLDDGGAA